MYPRGPYTAAGGSPSGAFGFRLVSPYWRCRLCLNTQRSAAHDYAPQYRAIRRRFFCATASTVLRSVMWKRVEIISPPISLSALCIFCVSLCGRSNP